MAFDPIVMHEEPADHWHVSHHASHRAAAHHPFRHLLRHAPHHAVAGIVAPAALQHSKHNRA